MDLLFCPPAPTDSIPIELVVNTMRAYWKPWLNERIAERAVKILELQALEGRVALEPVFGTSEPT